MHKSRPVTRARRLLLLVSMTATAVTFLAPSAQAAPVLTVAKTATDVDGDTLQPGDVIEYQIQITNGGADAATGVTLTDATPAGTAFVPDSATITDSTTVSPSPTNPFESGLLIDDIPGNGGSTTATFEVTVDTAAADGTAVDNTASVYADNDPLATQADPQTSSTSNTVAAPVLTVDKTSTPAEGETVAPGATIDYTILITNSGGDAATDVVLWDDTPENTEYVADSATIDDGTQFTDPSTNPFADPGLPIEDIPAGEDTQATFQVTVNRPLPDDTVISNTATVSASNHDDVSGGADVTVSSTPGLTMAKTSVPVEGGKVTPGMVIGYSVAITNNTAATETATNVVLTDPTPANTTYVAGSAKIDGTPIEGSGNPLASGYAVRDLPPGDTATISFDVKVATPLAKGTVISNLAKLTAANHPQIEDGATHTVDSAPVLKVTLSSDPKPGSKLEAGDKIAYGLVISNDPAATDSLQNVVVTAPTPEGTEYIKGSAKAGGTPSESSSSSRLAAPDTNPLATGSSLGNLAPGATRTLDWAVEVRSSAGRIQGTVTVTASNITAVTATTSHRGPNEGSGGGGGGGGGDEGAAFGPGSGGVASGVASDELAFTGLDLARLLTLALSLLLVGWTLMARGRSVQRRAATVPAEQTRVSGFPAWDRWAGAWFFPDKK